MALQLRRAVKILDDRTLYKKFEDSCRERVRSRRTLLSVASRNSGFSRVYGIGQRHRWLGLVLTRPQQISWVRCSDTRMGSNTFERGRSKWQNFGELLWSSNFHSVFLVIVFTLCADLFSLLICRESERPCHHRLLRSLPSSVLGYRANFIFM